MAQDLYFQKKLVDHISSEKRVPCEENLFHTTFLTSQGWVGLLGSSIGVRRLTLPQTSELQALFDLDPYGRVKNSTYKQHTTLELPLRIQKYMDGEAILFPDSLDLVGTSFQIAVWNIARRIPLGETRSYSYIAKQIGSPKAARAVGQAMKANPVPLIIPCHRVIGSDGAIGGFSGTTRIALKEILLQQEQTVVKTFG